MCVNIVKVILQAVEEVVPVVPVRVRHVLLGQHLHQDLAEHAQHALPHGRGVPVQVNGEQGDARLQEFRQSDTSKSHNMY